MILKCLPVLQWANYPEYLIEDAIPGGVDRILASSAARPSLRSLATLLDREAGKRIAEPVSAADRLREPSVKRRGFVWPNTTATTCVKLFCPFLIPQSQREPGEADGAGGAGVVPVCG